MAWPNNNPNTATFNGTDGTYTVTVANGLQGTGATFNASGYTLAGASAASPGSLTFAFGQPAVLNVATGKTMTVGANMTLTAFSGAFINYQNAAYAGSVVVNNGGVFNLGNSMIGGTLTVGPNGMVATGGSTPILNGATLNIDGAGANFTARGLTVLGASVINVNQGTLNPAGASGLGFNGLTLNLNGGTYVAGYAPTGGTASTVHLNGGLIVNSTTGYGNSVGNSNTTLLVQGGGARFNVSQSWNVAPGSGLLHDPAGPAIDGGVVVSGNGTVTLSVAGTYNGGTMVNGGMPVAAANGALGTGDASVIATSVSLKINAGVTTPFNNPQARLTLSGGGTANIADAGYLDLTSGANITVGGLVLGTTQYASGTFSSANFPEYFSGTGTLTVVPEPTSLACAMVLAGGLRIGWHRRFRRMQRLS